MTLELFVKNLFLYRFVVIKMVKINQESMKIITLFENKTRSNVKDFFEYNDILIFIVKEGQASKAVGKNGINVKNLSNLLRKKIKVVEFNSQPVSFIKGFIYPIGAEEITQEEGVIVIKVASTREKGLLIGRESRNLNKLKEIVKRYYGIEEIKIN